MGEALGCISREEDKDQPLPALNSIEVARVECPYCKTVNEFTPPGGVPSVIIQCRHCDVRFQAPLPQHGFLLPQTERAGTATVGIDTNGDGQANYFVTGLDTNHDGIPDVLESQAKVPETGKLSSARYGSQSFSQFGEDLLFRYTLEDHGKKPLMLRLEDEVERLGLDPYSWAMRRILKGADGRPVDPIVPASEQFPIEVWLKADDTVSSLPLSRSLPPTAAVGNGSMPPLSMLSTRSGNSEALAGWSSSRTFEGSMLPISPTGAFSQSTVRWNSTMKQTARERAQDALKKLEDGNKAYYLGRNLQDGIFTPRVDKDLDTDPIVMVACCSPLPAPLDVIFGVASSQLACVATASLEDCLGDDGGTAAVEFAMQSHHDVHLLIMMEIFGPGESRAEAEATMWEATKRLILKSDTVRTNLNRGSLYLHAALFDLNTGSINFKGNHPDQAKIIADAKPMRAVSKSIAMSLGTAELSLEEIRKPTIPAEEALAMLQCGNVRAAHKVAPAGRNVSTPRGVHGKEGEHEPFAVVFMNYDAHKGEAPLIERIFDIHPSQLATISIIPPEFSAIDPTASIAGSPRMDDFSLDQQWDGFLHTAEHCLTQHKPKLLLVLGRVPGDASQGRILTVKNQVFHHMETLIKKSRTVKAGVADEELQVHGAIYHGSAQMPPGNVEWLGTNPDQEGIVGKMVNSCSPQEFQRKTFDGQETCADRPEDHVNALELRLEKDPTFLIANVKKILSGEVITQLQDGNKRFLTAGTPVLSRWQPDYLPRKDKEANVIVLCGANGAVRSPEVLFHSQPGDLLIHRTCGAISGRRDGAALTYLESLVHQHREVTLLLILGDVLDPAINTAVTQVQCLSNPLRPENAQMAIDQLGPSAVYAWRDACQNMPEGSLSESEQQEGLVRYAAELHALYVQDRLLRDSKMILDLCKEPHPRLEIRSAVVDKDGSVRFLGKPTDIEKYVERFNRVEKHQRKGLGLSKQSLRNASKMMAA